MKIGRNLTILSVMLSSLACAHPEDYELSQVLIISRHGLRAPLTDGNNILTQVTPYTWPRWDTDGGMLTTKGGALEVFMGGYFKDWLTDNQLIKKNECPDSLFVYTNTVPRTIATGQFFVDGLFPGCRVHIDTQASAREKDPIFYQSIKDDSDAFVTSNKKSIADFIRSEEFQSSYETLENIIDYKNSVECKNQQHCSLNEEKNIINLDKGKEPSISGPLNKAFLMVDAFILENYEGFDHNQVAWGKINTPETWKALAKLRNGYVEAAYLQPNVARNTVTPLLERVSTLLPEEMDADTKKVNILVGHDTTLGPLMKAMNFDDYDLPNQYEKNPIGGKLVFQRWKNKKTHQDSLKVEYIYQSTDQLRNLTPLSRQAPPQRVTLSLKGCPVDSEGLCSWSDFKATLLHTLKE